MLSNISRRSWAVWQRNKDVFFFTWKTNFLPPFLEPILYLLAMGFGFGMLIQELPPPWDQYTYAEFLGPGLIAISAMYGAFFECTYGSFVRMHYQKTFDAIVATPLTIEDVIAGEILWGATKSFINASIVALVVAAFGLLSFPSFLLVIPITFLAGLAFGALAMIFTALVPNIDSFNYPFFLLITPMFLFSGTFFPLEILPEGVQAVALALPLTHTTIVMRDFGLGLFGWMDLLSLLYLTVLTLVAFYAAVWMMRRRLVS
ncbi:MAG: ABC transporter permease [Methanomassiliicoccales archaeon]|nr:ABC transporter permease [Methanomassiliicoccales archaeon]